MQSGRLLVTIHGEAGTGKSVLALALREFLDSLSFENSPKRVQISDAIHPQEQALLMDLLKKGEIDLSRSDITIRTQDVKHVHRR